MKVNALLNNYQREGNIYSRFKDNIIAEKRKDRGHTKITWDLDESQLSELVTLLGDKCLMHENGLYIFKCVICGKIEIGYGNNPQPVAKFGFCCDDCNKEKVMPARIKALTKAKGVTK